MKAVFFGSPAFAVPCFEALTTFADVVAVVSQPDRPAGRGLKLRAPAVKVAALAAGVPVHQPTKVRTRAFADEVAAFGADVGVVVAYGRILPRAVLDAPRLGCVNVHASLLPRWRGAAPIQWAIAAGDTETGVTLMKMDEGMDTGPMLAQRTEPIGFDDTTEALSDRLSKLGAQLLSDALPAYVRGELSETPQDDAHATHARLLKKSDGQLDWSESAVALYNRIRAMNPWPGATASLDGLTVKVHSASVRSEAPQSDPAGTVLGLVDGALDVVCGCGVLAIDELQQSGKKRMGAAEFVAGQAGRA